MDVSLTSATYVESLLTAPGTIQLGRREISPLAEDWVRVRFAYCGLCGSDLSRFEGRRAISYPLSLGHELVGEVVHTGRAVVGLRRGDLVVSDLNFRCGQCDQCLVGRSHLCRRRATELFSNRAFAQLGDLHESYLVRVDGALRASLAMAEPLSCVLHAKAWAAPRASERILVVGAGGLGTAMAFTLHHDALKFDITDAMPERSALIAGVIEPVGRAIKNPEVEYDVVFDLSGTESGLRAACAHVVPGGRVCSMSHIDGAAPGAFLLTALTRRDVSFKVSYLNGERSNVAHAAELLRDAWDASWDAVVDIIPLEGLAQAFHGRRASPWCKTVIRI